MHVGIDGWFRGIPTATAATEEPTNARESEAVSYLEMGRDEAGGAGGITGAEPGKTGLVQRESETRNPIACVYKRNSK